MSNLTPNQQIIANDILKYKTNKFAATLALVGIVFNALYFCMLYSFTTNFFSTWEIGISVVLTLFSLLLIFLASEGIKGYNKKYTIVLLVLAAVQIIRIFGLPLEAYKHDVDAAVAQAAGQPGVLYALNGGYFFKTITYKPAFALLIIWLALSAASLVASAVIGYINCVKLEKHVKATENGEIDIDQTLRAMDEEDERQAQNVVSEANLTENEMKLIEEDENA